MLRIGLGCPDAKREREKQKDHQLEAVHDAPLVDGLGSGIEKNGLTRKVSQRLHAKKPFFRLAGSDF